MYRKKIVIPLVVVLLMVLAAAGVLYGPTLASEGATQTESDIRVHPARGQGTAVVEGARARIVSTDNGVSYSFQTHDLEPGVYTLWFVTVNAPENCNDSPCSGNDVLNNPDAKADVVYGAGHVVGKSGRATFAGSKVAGPLANSWFDRGLTNPRGAEIHLVLHSHGPSIPELQDNMIHTLRGGCTDESVPPPYPDVAKADDIPGPNTCQLYQFAILQQ